MTDIAEEITPNGSENQDEILNKLEDVVVEIVNDSNLNPKEKAVTIISNLTSHEYFSGPLPSPRMMADYNTIIPGAAERIMIMAEEQHRHRISLEKNIMPNQVKQSERGQYFAFGLCFLLILLAGYCVYKEANLVAFSIVTTTIIVVTGLFITGRLMMRKDLKNKARED